MNMENLPTYLLAALASLIALSVHEYSHACAADRLGDPTARSLGRLTLNPLKHIDVIGAICMVLFHFGWAKPVPINMRNFKKPRRDFALTAAAGPLSNLLLALFTVPVYLLLYKGLSAITYTSDFGYNIAVYTLTFFLLFHQINLGLAVFNMIPVPPLDGSRLLGLILPPKAYYAILKKERVIYFCVLGWLLVGDAVANILLSVPALAASPVIRVIATILSLSDLLGYAISGLSGLMFRLWTLIPFLSFL